MEYFAKQQPSEYNNDIVLLSEAKYSPHCNFNDNDNFVQDDFDTSLHDMEDYVSSDSDTHSHSPYEDGLRPQNYIIQQRPREFDVRSQQDDGRVAREAHT